MKNLFSKTLALAAIGTVVTFSACEKSEHEGYEKAENGLFYKFYTQNEQGVKPKEGDMVKVVMLYKNDKDSVLFDTKDPKVNRNGDATIEFPLSKSSFKGSFEDALQMMAVGDSASFLVSADSVYLKTFMAKELPPHVAKGSLLTFEVMLKKVTSKEEVEKERNKMMEEQRVMMEMRKGEESKTLAKYIEDNKITVKPTESGLYFIETKKGNGKHPAKGDRVKVNYTLGLVDGKILETTVAENAKAGGIFQEGRPYMPAEFLVYSTKPGQALIAGMNEGLSMMTKGSKAKLLIPSAIGYGEGGGAMPPYATLVFEVEMIDFGPAPADVENPNGGL